MSRRDWPNLRRVFRIPSSATRVRDDVDAELEFHIQGRVEELMSLGMSHDEAESEARRRFGDYRRIGSEVERLDRGAHRRRSLADRIGIVVADVRYAARTLIHQPVFSIVVIITLTLGIATTTAIFHTVDRAVLHPLPYPHAERIVYLGWEWAGKGGYANALSARKFVFWNEHSRVFDALGTSRAFETSLGDDPTAPAVQAMRISRDYLRVLGMQPALGRAFTADDYVLGAPSPVILSHPLWVSRFGGDPSIVGREIRLDETPYTVVGVMPEAFEVAEQTEWSQLLVPLRLTREELADGGHNYMAIGRLRPDVSAAQVAADMAEVFKQYRTAAPDAAPDDRGARLFTYQSVFVGDLASWLWIMLGATMFVMVLACANVANLLLARSLSRHREFAVRTALGAARSRIVRQVVIEVTILGVVSALLATAAGLASVRGVVALAQGALLRESQLHLDPRVVVYTTLIALAASLGVGLAVSLSATRVDLARALAEGGRTNSLGRRQRTFRDLLVASESAIAMMLLAGAGLLIASFVRVMAVDPGYRREGVFTAAISRAPVGYDSAAAVWQFERRVLEQLRTTPGIISAGGSSTLPLRSGWNLPMTIDGRPNDSQGNMEWRGVSPSYFQTFGIRMIAGRDIKESDAAGAPPVVVISQSFAQRYWPNESPIGRRIHIGRYKGKSIADKFDEPPREIVGVVADLRDGALDKAIVRQTAWVPQAQAPRGMVRLPSFAVRANDAGVAATALRRAIAEADPRMGDTQIAAMTDIVSTSLAWRRFVLVLMTVFALLALSLTCVGIYGVVAYSVAQRVHEIGVRMALGAQPGSVIALVVAQGMRPAVIGLAIGLVGSLGASRFLSKLLYEVSPHDPMSLGAVAVVLGAVAFLASYVPARRAARVDPLTALRAE